MTVEMIIATVGIAVSVLLVVMIIILAVQLRNSRRETRGMHNVLNALGDQVAAIRSVPSVARAINAPQHTALVINPTKSDAAKAREQVHAAARLYGLPAVQVYETTVDDPGAEAARQAVRDGAEAVLACGGDGTVRSVSEALAGTEVAMGILPVGTGNLLARNLELPITNMEKCIAIALQGEIRKIDTVEIKMRLTDGTDQRQVFTVIAGSGIDAEIMNDTRDVLKQRTGWLAYGEAGMRHLPGKRKPVSISIDGSVPKKYQVRSVMVANCGLLTGGIDFVPEASINDGLLDVVMLAPRNFADWMRIAGKTVLKMRAELPVLETRQGTRCRIDMHEPMVAQMDGDATTEVTQINARVRPDSLTVRTPTIEPSR